MLHGLALSRYHVCYSSSSRIPVLTQVLSTQRYVALKVCVSNYPSIEREHAAYAHLREVLKTHSESLESSLVRSSLSDFELPGVEGLHRCFVFQPLTIDLVATRAAVHPDEALFKTITFYVFRALDFLHTKAKMVHCGTSLHLSCFLSCNLSQDIRAENFSLTALDQITFQKLEALEIERPSPRKIYCDRIIYDGFGQVMPEDGQLLGIPILCDFGEARFGQDYYDGPIQPFMYQAPEVVFKASWSYPTDIWNAGVMVSV